MATFIDSRGNKKDVRNVRNFWVEIDCGGRKELISAGSNDYITINMYQRDSGEVVHTLRINCTSFTNMTDPKASPVLVTRVTNVNKDDDFSDSWGYESPYMFESVR